MGKDYLNPYRIQPGVDPAGLSPVFLRILESEYSGKEKDLRLQRAFDCVWKSFCNSKEATRTYINQMQREGHFWESWFEMYFWHYLRTQSLSPKHNGEGHSDAQIKWRNRKVQFENTSPKPGREGSENEVRSRRLVTARQIEEEGMAAISKKTAAGFAVSEEELDLITQRITAAFTAKAQRFEQRLHEGKIGANEHCVIVIDVSQVRKIERFSITDIAFRALYGLGNNSCVWDKKGEIGLRRYEVRKLIQRLGKGDIETDYFLGRKDFKHIAAVIFCDANISDFAAGKPPKFYVFHNFHARNSLSRKLFRRHEQFSPLRLGTDVGLLRM